MKCPIDQTELLMTERHGVEIDYCPKCRGVWLDRGELDKIIEMSTPEVALANPDPAPEPVREPPRGEPRYEEPRYEDRHREDRYDRREDRRDDRYDNRDAYKSAKRYKKKRRKSFLEEVFDIFD
ncbi:zf-TFIIB domain-containing protein [Aliiroseovarius sp.]|uniref:TFIIB-type zinc ribbon-containing protein n=1 Tax=Aliiroseovarius sp. TaxID=1872442 RepID=UPI003BAC7CF3